MFYRYTLWLVPALTTCLTSYAQEVEDPYLWLEDVTGAKAIEWVKEQNAKTQKRFETLAEFTTLRNKTLEIVNSHERIPAITKHAAHFYNFWQDDDRIRGVWRRTSLQEYKKRDPVWETVLDLDQLAQEEKENWGWKRYTCLYPTYDRCLIALSRGGADAVVVREFDVVSKTFVKDGFILPEAKGSLVWIDRNTVLVQTDFGAGSMTQSGYPRIVKEWRRGTPLAHARVVFEGKDSDVGVEGFQVEQQGLPGRQFVRRGVTFFTRETYFRDGNNLIKLDIPPDARPSFFHQYFALHLKSEWKMGSKTYAQGALIVIDFDRFMKGARNFDVLFAPAPRRALGGFHATQNYVLINELDHVKSRLYEFKHSDGKWHKRNVALPGFGNVKTESLDVHQSDAYFLTLTDYLTPSTLYLAQAGSDEKEKLKALPAFFDASSLKVEQFEAASRDGERIPYFLVMAKDAKQNGSHPTLLYGYGGFEVSQLPAYNPVIGHAWLSKGGAYVVANIRGGGEFGPRWHQAGLKANRQNVYDDFIAVAEDLIARKITSPQHLAIYGGSNGGLLVGAVAVQRPDLFKAAVCAVPLLDMKRYHKLLAGASWVAEYGNPDDPKEWAYLSKYSPYQNVKQGVRYPTMMFLTSTRDDRVHPGHARKMAARMIEQGHKVLYYENMEGGHAASANNAQIAYRTALMYSFLLNELK